MLEEFDNGRSSAREPSVDIEAVKRLVESRASCWESEGLISEYDWLRLGETGCLAVEPKIQDLDTLTLLETLGELGYAGARSAIAVNAVMAKSYLDHSHASPHASVLASVSNGSKVLALALTESGSGSVLNVQTSAARFGTRFYLDGHKSNIANGTVSDYVITLARTSEIHNGSTLAGCTLFLVDKQSQPNGLSISKSKLTCWLSADVCDLSFDGFKVGEENVIGRIDGAMLPLMRGLRSERFFASALALGGVAYTIGLIDRRIRSADSDQINLRNFQVVRHAFVDLRAKYRAIRARLKEICHGVLHEQSDPSEAMETKILATKLESEAADLLRAISGARVYAAGTHLERTMRDSYASSITAGPNDLLRDLLYAPS